MKTETIHEEMCYWAVRIDAGNGPVIATGKGGGPNLFFNKTIAKRFCTDLQDRLNSKCTVIRVNTVIYEILLRKGR